MKRGFLLFALSAFLLLGAGCASLRPGGGFKPLFNGKDLTGWHVKDGNAAVWKAEDGMIVVEGERGGWLTSDKTYDDFVLRLDWKLPKDGNSGVGIRFPAQGDPAHEGMEIQILDDQSTAYGKLDPAQLTGSLYYQAESKHGVMKPTGEWNHYEITANGPKVTVKLNGVVVNDVDVTKYTEGRGGHKSLSERPRSGFVGLQSHGSRVEFKNLEIKEL